MKKVILSVFILLSFWANAQEKSFISISGGAALPIGNFASPSGVNFYNYQLPGFAKSGYHVEVDGSKFFSANFGFSGMAGIANNSFDKVAFQEYNNGGGIFATSSYYNLNRNVTNDYSVKSYFHIFALVGPTIGYKQDNVSIEGRFLMGFLNTSYPNLDYTITTASTGYYNSQQINITTIEKGKSTAPAATSLALSLGAVFRYKIAAHLAFIFKTEYIWATQTYNTTSSHSYTSNDPNQNNSYLYSVNQLPQSQKEVPVTLFNIGFGLGYEF